LPNLRQPRALPRRSKRVPPICSIAPPQEDQTQQQKQVDPTTLVCIVRCEARDQQVWVEISMLAQCAFGSARPKVQLWRTKTQRAQTMEIERVRQEVLLSTHSQPQQTWSLHMNQSIEDRVRCVQLAQLLESIAIVRLCGVVFVHRSSSQITEAHATSTRI
jgi:hypothetical protein